MSKVAAMASAPDVALDALYRDSRERMLALAADFDDEMAAVTVPGCPAWTVKDVYAHVTGIVDDALHDRMAGAPGDEWTARQVDARRTASLAEVCSEWAAQAPVFESVLAEGGPPQVVMDIWTHEQDVRGALGRPGARDAAAVPYCRDNLILFAHRSWARSDLAPIRIVTAGGDWLVGQGWPVATLRTSDYELVRAMFGRRSRRQFLALDWDGGGEPFVDPLQIFTLPDRDVVER